MDSAPLFTGTDELSMRMARHDWGASALGVPASWPAAIRTVVRLMLDSKTAMFVFWARNSA